MEISYSVKHTRLVTKLLMEHLGCNPHCGVCLELSHIDLLVLHALLLLIDVDLYNSAGYHSCECYRHIGPDVATC